MIMIHGEATQFCWAGHKKRRNTNERCAVRISPEHKKKADFVKNLNEQRLFQGACL